MASTQFTALIRLPFPRGNFVDPPQAQWDAEKDRQLWKVISKSSKTSDLNWVELASKFQVPPTFLLQQAAWLYERHFEHVRNQEGATATFGRRSTVAIIPPTSATAKNSYAPPQQARQRSRVARAISNGQQGAGALDLRGGSAE